MKLLRIICATLLFCLLFSACTGDLPEESSVTADTSEISAETAEPSPYAEIENSTEIWLKKGLEAYLSGYIPEFDAASFYADSANSGILSLYNDMYYYNRDAFEPTAELLFRFIMDEYGCDALFDTSKRIEYKNAWLKSLDPSLSYANDPESEEILSAMICDYDTMFEYIITLEGATYSFYSYNETISPGMAHMILYQNVLARRTLNEKIAEIDPDGRIFDLSVPLEYVMVLDGSPAATAADNKMYLGKYEDALAVTVNAMLKNNDSDALWIKEGLAEMFGKAYDYHYLTTYDRAFFIQPDYLEYFQNLADQGNLSALYYLGISAYYYSEGGECTRSDDNKWFIDNILYTHAAALSEMDTGYYNKLSDLMTVSGDGNDLSRCQAASFLLYLIEQTSLDTVFNVYLDYSTFEENFGGDYETVKADWLAWLSDKLSH